jgi:hypothetical protein
MGTAPPLAEAPPHAVPAAALKRLEACPWVRPEAVARARARLARSTPSPREVADSLVECLVAERAR